MERGGQYKVVQGTDVLCVFSVQHDDPFIWRERDRGDALYLHRIATHPHCRGQR